MVDIHGEFSEPSAQELDVMRERMYSYIFPNHPRGESQTAAFDKACRHQIDHEKTVASASGDANVPQGCTSFSIGDFSMSFDANAVGFAITRKTVCPITHGILLREGLLYKGVERSY